MAITLEFLNRNVEEDGVKIYKSETPFTTSNLPPVYDTIEPGSIRYRDTSVNRGEEFYYMVETFRGSDRAFSNTMLAKALAIDTGPGPSRLVGGDSRTGYYGTLSSSELITGDALASLVGLTAGTSQYSNTDWLKYSLDGKTVFVSKKNIRNSVSWDHLNAVNVVNNSRTITIQGEQYRIGLLKGLGPDTSGYVRNTYDTPATYGSEWNRLMYPVSIDIPSYPKTSQTIDNWASFPQDDSADGLNITAGNGRYSWTQETDPTNTTYRVGRGYNSVTNLRSGTSSDTYADVGWRVRLELVTS